MSLSHQSIVDNIANNIDGCVCAFFCGYDGIIIFKKENQKSTIDPDYFAANFVSVIKKINIDENQLEEIIASFKSNSVAIHIMEDGFMGIIMSLDGNIGRAKLEMKKLGKRFL